MALVVAAPSPEGGGGGEQGGGQRGPRGQARSSLVLRGSGQLGPNGLSGAGHKRRRQGTNDIGKATNGSSGEAGKKTMAKLETTSTGNTTAQRKDTEDNSSENSGTGGSSDGSSNGGACSAGRDKEIGGGGKEGVLTY
jgi:hypothetical protein